MQVEIVRHCYYPAARSADPHLRLRDWAGGGGGGGAGNGSSGVSDIEGVLDGEEEKELRLNAGKQGVVQNDGSSAVQNSDNIWYRVTMVVRVTMVL